MGTMGLDVGTKGFNVGTNLTNRHQNWRPNYPNFKNKYISFNAVSATKNGPYNIGIPKYLDKVEVFFGLWGPKKMWEHRCLK